MISKENTGMKKTEPEKLTLEEIAQKAGVTVEKLKEYYALHSLKYPERINRRISKEKLDEELKELKEKVEKMQANMTVISNTMSNKV